MSKRRYFVCGTFVLLLLAGVVGWLNRESLCTETGRWLDVSQNPRPATYGLVLTGDMETRPFTMAALYKAGLVEKVLIPQSAPTPETDDGVDRCEHEIIRDVLLARGVPREDIALLPGAGWSTYEEAQMLASFLKDKPEQTVTIVTSDFHTRRTRWTFKRVLGDRAVGIQIFGARNERFSPEDWWRSPEGTVKYASEYAKLVYYAIKY